jgi:type IV secretory pathway component VirB8
MHMAKKIMMQVRFDESDRALLDFCVKARNQENKSDFIRLLITEEFKKILQERETEALLNPLQFVVVENQKEEENEQNTLEVDEYSAKPSLS